ncbi:MAG TPA: YetF domain-containing protein [Rudaea sp.]|nr:YetF domain-containing protein [Rudaea sp.]
MLLQSSAPASCAVAGTMRECPSAMSEALIHPEDWHRLLAGTTPWLFLIEVAARALLVYFALIVAMRVLGRRVAAKLTLFELSIVVTLAATAGAVLESPNRGLLPAAVAIFVTVAVQRGIAYWGTRRRSIERLATGPTVTAVADGRIMVDATRAELISNEKLFCRLRNRGVQHLGEVSRLYIEPSGAFSIVRATDPKPGLSVLPYVDETLRREAACAEVQVCATCGHRAESAHERAHACRYCGSTQWTVAAKRLEQ